MRILITGHKGYIGSVMVPMLLDAGQEVVGLDSDLFRDCTFAPGICSVPELRLEDRKCGFVGCGERILYATRSGTKSR